jgi:hypothetical protein
LISSFNELSIIKNLFTVFFLERSQGIPARWP